MDMKRLILVAMVAAVAVAFTGCKKKETVGDKLNKAAASAEKSAASASKDAEKAAGDLQKKLDETLKK
jgi:hypothetical protein